MSGSLEVISSIMNFAGGAFLTWDALYIKQKIQAKTGIQRLQEGLAEMGAGDLLTHRGKPLKEGQTFQLWLSSRPLRWTKIGFALMTLGFLLDLVTKVGIL